MAGVLKRTCKHCDTAFQTTDPRKIFCHKNCAQRHHALQQHARKKRIRDSWTDQDKDYKLRKTYGIGLDDYNQMFEEQNGCCYLCGRHQTEFKKRLCVDHCHKTGKIRKLLCQRCNHAIGLFDENPEIIKKALEYII